MAIIGGGYQAYGVGGVNYNYGGPAVAYNQAPQGYSQTSVQLSLQAGYQLQSSWGGFLGSNYAYPQQPNFGPSLGGGGTQFGFAGAYPFGGQPPYLGFLPSGFADVPDFGVISPFGQRDQITGPFGFGTLNFPPTEQFGASPFFSFNGPQTLAALNYPEVTRGGQQLGLFGNQPVFQQFQPFPGTYGGLPAGGLNFGASPFGFGYGLPPYFG